MNIVRATSVEPDVVCPVFGGCVQVCMFAKPGDYANVGKVRGDPREDTIVRTASRLGIKDLYIPRTVEFNAVVVDPVDQSFPETWEVDGVRIHAGDIFADGVVLRPGCAFLLRSADCPVFIVRGEEKERKIVAAHAGFKSLIDRSFVLRQTSERRAHESVVFAALEKLGLSGRRLSCVQAAMLCGIKPEHYMFPVNSTPQGLENIRLVEYLRNYSKECAQVNPMSQISLVSIAQAQLRQLQVPVNDSTFQTDDIDTYRDPWHSNRRGDQGRNGVLVMYTP